MIIDKVFEALGYLFVSGVVFSIWKQSCNNSRKEKVKIVLLKGLLLCGGFALFASLILGSPTCEQFSDPVYGGCEQYSDDGYEPTSEERVANFTYFFILLYLPVVLGSARGYKEKQLFNNV